MVSDPSAATVEPRRRCQLTWSCTVAAPSLIVALGLGYAQEARAYRTASDDLGTSLPVVQSPPEVEVVLYGDAPPGVDGDSVGSSLETATRAWDVDCGTLSFQWSGASGVPPNDSDGVTTVSSVFEGWEERGYRRTRAAITELVYVETPHGFEIVDADILLNADTFDWAAPDAPDLVSVLVHELGHCAGLAHPCSHAPTMGEPSCAEHPDLAADSVMHPNYQERAWEPRADDVEGVCHLYPRSPCDGVVCGLNEVCDGGACVMAPNCDSGSACAAGVCATGGQHEGSCIPYRSEGAPCMTGDECQSRLCLTSMEAGSYCTRSCTTDPDCSAMQRCAEVDGRYVCAPLPASSCAVSSTPVYAHDSAVAWGFLFAASLLWWRKTRRRRPSRWRF